MKRKLPLKCLFGEGEQENWIIYRFFSEEGETQGPELRAHYEKCFQRDLDVKTFEEKGFIKPFYDKKEMLHYLVSLCDEISCPQIQILSREDYNHMVQMVSNKDDFFKHFEMKCVTLQPEKSKESSKFLQRFFGD